LFNTLATMLDLRSARFLDLYAGSGAVGLEALSRGADVTLVESDRAARAVLERNVAVVGRATVIGATVDSYLAGQPTGEFDVVFADPPYALDDSGLAKVLTRLVAGNWLSVGSTVVVERSARSNPPLWPNPLDSVKQKRYGEGMFWYGRADECV